MPGDMIGTLRGRLKPESLDDHLKVLSIPQKGQAATQTPRGKGRSGGHLMRRASSSVKTLMLGKIKGKRRGDGGGRGGDGEVASPAQWT